MTAPKVVVVGGSTAGMAVVRELREIGYDGSVAVISDEPDLGYQRPPLSKRGLREDLPAGESITDLELDVVIGSATGLDNSLVRLSDDRTVEFDSLVIATGARPRRLAAPGQLGELVLRNLHDARALRAALDTGTSAIVVGAGFLGMEVATACLERGMRVTVVDVDRPLERLLGPFASRLVEGRLDSAGGRFLQGRAALVGNPVTGVMIDGVDGGPRPLCADIVVTCVGDVPNVEWLHGSGVHLADGVVVDGGGRTNLPSIFAAGDVACAARAGKVVRQPFWANAMAQGRLVAHSLLERGTELAWWDDYFWTEVMGYAVKVAGPVPVSGEPDLVEGSFDTGALLRWNGDEGPTVVAWGRRISSTRLRRLIG